MFKNSIFVLVVYIYEYAKNASDVLTIWHTNICYFQRDVFIYLFEREEEGEPQTDLPSTVSLPKS